MLEVVAAVSLFLGRRPRLDNVTPIDVQIFWDTRDGWDSDTVPIVYNMGGSIQIDWPGVAPGDEEAIQRIIEWCTEENIPVVHRRR